MGIVDWIRRFLLEASSDAPADYTVLDNRAIANRVLDKLTSRIYCSLGTIQIRWIDDDPPDTFTIAADIEQFEFFREQRGFWKWRGEYRERRLEREWSRQPRHIRRWRGIELAIEVAIPTAFEATSRLRVVRFLIADFEVTPPLYMVSVEAMRGSAVYDWRVNKLSRNQLGSIIPHSTITLSSDDVQDREPAFVSVEELASPTTNEITDEQFFYVQPHEKGDVYIGLESSSIEHMPSGQIFFAIRGYIVNDSDKFIFSPTIMIDLEIDEPNGKEATQLWGRVPDLLIPPDVGVPFCAWSLRQDSVYDWNLISITLQENELAFLYEDDFHAETDLGSWLYTDVSITNVNYDQANMRLSFRVTNTGSQSPHLVHFIWNLYNGQGKFLWAQQFIYSANKLFLPGHTLDLLAESTMLLMPGDSLGSVRRGANLRAIGYLNTTLSESDFLLADRVRVVKTL